jgi:hypothetical protein
MAATVGEAAPPPRASSTGAYAAQVLLIDTPRWPAHGRLWAHLVSDTSIEELHDFAAAQGLPRRSFEGDHYDVPAERHAQVVASGALLVDGRSLVQALQRSGLRRPKLKGERVLASRPHGEGRLDVVAGAHPQPGADGVLLVVLRDDHLLVSDAADGPDLPGAAVRAGDPEAVAAALAGDLGAGTPRPVGYLRRTGSEPRRTAVVSAEPAGQGSGAARWVDVAHVRLAAPERDWWPLVDELTGLDRAPAAG